MQAASYGVWTQFAVSISHDDNHNPRKVFIIYKVQNEMDQENVCHVVVTFWSE